LLDLQRNHSRPGDSDVQAIVRLAARRFRRIISRAGREPDVPILGGSDLRGVSRVSADEASEQLACLGRDIHGEQEMSHHWHPVTAKDESLNIPEVERTSRRFLRMRLCRRGFVPTTLEDAA
jgi:hypothetical protein